MAKKGYFWCAFVMCAESVENQTITSYLSFWADNRFKALKAVEGMLPDNPKWLSISGNLRPYTILALHQCKEENSNFYAQIYMNQFRAAVGLAQDEGNLESLLYR